MAQSTVQSSVQSNKTVQQGQTYYVDAAKTADTSSLTFASGARGGLILSSLDTSLVDGIRATAEASEAERNAANEAFREKAQETALTVSKYCPALIPFAAAAYLMVEGAIALSNLLEEDQNSEEEVRACLELVDRYAQLGVIAKAFNPEQEGGFRDYRRNLETGLRYIAALDEGLQAAIYRVGELIKKHGHDDRLRRFIDAPARSSGFVGPPPRNEVLPEVAAAVAAAVSLESGHDFARLNAIALNVMENTRQTVYEAYLQSGKSAGAPDDPGQLTSAKQYSVACLALLDFAAANPGPSEIVTLPGGITVKRGGMRLARTEQSSALLARAALAGIKPQGEPAGASPGTVAVVGTATAVGVGLWLFKTAGGFALRRALGF